MKGSRYSLAVRVITLMMVGVLFFSQSVAALSIEQKNLMKQGILQFDIQTDAPSGDCSSGASLTLTGDSAAAQATNFLQSKGLTTAQAAGVVGNLLAESSLMPNRKQGTGIQTINSFSEVTPGVGYGIAQWTSGGRQNNWRDFAEQQKMDPLSLALQLAFLWHEFEANPGDYGLDQLTTASDVRQATWIFLSYYERSGTVVDAGLVTNPTQPTSGPAKDTLDTRVAIAVKVSGGSISGSPQSSCTGSTTGDTGGIYSANGYTFPLQISRDTILSQKPFVWCYNQTKNCHHDYNAADIFSPTGTTVVAIRGGRVATVHDDALSPSTEGSRVAIMGDDGWLYYYAHMGDNTLLLHEGQQITAGTPIGKIGTKENAAGTQTHLHIDRLPGAQYQSRVTCAGTACKGYPFDNIQALLYEIFKAVK